MCDKASCEQGGDSGDLGDTGWATVGHNGGKQHWLAAFRSHQSRAEEHLSRNKIDSNPAACVPPFQKILRLS